MSQTRKTGYLPGLNGWRALAVLGVMFAHDATWKPWHVGQTSLFDLQLTGASGVELFFAISGFLICWRLIADEAKLGTIRLKSFYIRRLFRIQPASYFYLGCVAVLMLAGVLPDHWRYWWQAVFAFRNLSLHVVHTELNKVESPMTSHFWSLAVEEHFYILLSLFLVFVRRKRIFWLGTSLVILLGGQSIAQHLHLYSNDLSPYRTYWIIQYLWFASFISLLVRKPEVMVFVERVLHPWVAFCLSLAPMMLLIAWIEYRHPAVPLLKAIFWTRPTLWYGFIFWVISTTFHPASWTTRMLEWRPFQFVGLLSYSLYLWHILFFFATDPELHITWKPLLLLGSFPLRYLVSFGMAYLSYRFIEKPLIQLGHRLAPPALSGNIETESPSDTHMGSIAKRADSPTREVPN